MAITRFYLFVNDLGTTVWRAAGKSLAEYARCPADLDGMAAFETLVAQYPDAHWHLLFDLLEEDYRIETIPHANPRDRRLMVERRLQQLYRESGYRSYAFQGREAEGRRDHRVLFTALTNPTPLDRWVMPLMQAGARIAAIHSVALLTSRYAIGAKAIPHKALIVSRQTGSGLRQTYIADGALRFSRLTTIDDDSLEALSDSLISEAARARQFLASLRALERNEAMQVVMLCSTEACAQLRARCPDSELIHYHFLDLVQVAHALGSVSDPGVAMAEPMWLRLIAKRAPPNQYATPAQRKPYLAWQIGRGLFVGGTLLLLGGLLAGAYLWQDSQALDRSISALDQRTATAEATYAANQADIKEGELSPTGMKHVVQSYRQLVEEWPALADGLSPITEIVNRYPMLDLDALVWMISSQPSAMPAGLLGATSSAPLPAAAPMPVEGAAAPPTGRYLIIGIRGQLIGYQLRYREALAIVDEIAQALQVRPDATVEKLQLPIDTRPEGTVDLGSTTGTASAGAPFTLKLTLPLNPSPAPQEETAL
ncbi:hypothetical protein [Chitinimonas sp. BJYL2]|uniref:hypothetical protein n=1 Tax=Chitinimonas sp. BJYL2 TaxID=2976696 RepID=UPI0022B3D1B7|nr:hypothetical protein [Chitinimonas sp. BJYL2]